MSGFDELNTFFIGAKRTAEGKEVQRSEVQRPEVVVRLLQDTPWDQMYSVLLAVSENRSQMLDHLLNLRTALGINNETLIMKLWLVRSPAWPLLIQRVNPSVIAVMMGAMGADREDKMRKEFQKRLGITLIGEILQPFKKESLAIKFLSSASFYFVRFSLHSIVRSRGAYLNMGMHIQQFDRVFMMTTIYIARAFPFVMGGQTSLLRSVEEVVKELRFNAENIRNSMLNMAFNTIPDRDELVFNGNKKIRRGQNFDEAERTNLPSTITFHINSEDAIFFLRQTNDQAIANIEEFIKESLNHRTGSVIQISDFTRSLTMAND